MQFWRYDLEEALCWMTSVWWTPTSRPVVTTVLGVAAGVALITRLASV